MMTREEAINYNKIVINTNIWILTIIYYMLHLQRR